MKTIKKTVLGFLLAAGAAMASAGPADAAARISIGIAAPGFNMFLGNDCYPFAQAMPWGAPRNFCAYSLYYQPVYYGGRWYRGPIYYKAARGQRMFWINNGWRYDQWRGHRPTRIDWRARGNVDWHATPRASRDFRHQGNNRHDHGRYDRRGNDHDRDRDGRNHR